MYDVDLNIKFIMYFIEDERNQRTLYLQYTLSLRMAAYLHRLT